MSNLFELSRMLKESYSPTIVKTFSNVTYLSECLNILRSNDERVFEETSKLYSSVLEADSRKAENAQFADFFKEYQSIINDYILKIQALSSEFSINVETFADANADILTDNGSTNIVSPIIYKGAKYSHLLDPEVPEVEPYKAFKKEFAFIGKLMQDLGPIGTEDQKAQIIATVCNNLSKEINDGWLDKVIEKITDCDDCKRDEYAKVIYKTFVPEPCVDMTIDIGLVKQSKLDIANYKGYIDSITNSIDKFIDGLQKIASEVGSMFFRNQDHKLPIKTDVDGVEDKTYRLNDYSFSQMNMFISTKISQITELCNLYMVAIGIKMDCIIKYLQQCKDIIDAAASGVDNTPNTNDAHSGEDDEAPESDEEDDTESDDDSDEEDDDEDESEDDDQDSEEKIVQDNSDTEIEQECYLFEAVLFEKERAINKYTQKKAIYEALIKEADAQDIKNAIQDKARSAEAFIDSIINQIRNLIKNMVNSITNNYSPVIKSVKDNQGEISKVKIPDGWTIQKVDHKPLLNVKVADFSVQDIDVMTSNKVQYLTSKYPTIMNSSKIKEGSNSAKDMILSTLMDEKESPYNGNEMSNSLQFITSDYEKIASVIENMTNRLSSQKNAAQNAAKVGENTVMDFQSTYSMYFEDAAEVPKDQQKATNKAEAGKTYFKLNSEVITAMMNINTMLIKKHLNFISKLANIAGIQISIPSNGKDNK